jgi:hypothetical protein
MSEYSRATSLNEDVVKLVKKYGENELAISEADIGNIAVLWYTPKTVPSGWVTKTVKNPTYCSAFGLPPISIILVKASFDDMQKSEIRAHLFHALMRINFEENSGSYKLVNPDINDFASIIAKIGLYYEKSEDMFSDDALDLHEDDKET